MPSFMYRCPSTGMNAEVWYEIDDDPSESADGYFETAVCRACGEAHLIDPKTGKVAGLVEIKQQSSRGTKYRPLRGADLRFALIKQKYNILG